jgi:hypothetical protein
MPFNRQYVRSMVEQMQRGKRLGAANGKPPTGKAPYPYSYSRETRRVELDPIWARVTKEVYNWIVEEGLSAQAAAYRLNQKVDQGDLDYASVSGKPWRGSTIRKILHHPWLRGDFSHFRWRTEYAGGKTRTKSRPEKERIVGEAAPPALFTQAEYNRLRQAFTHHKAESKRNTKSFYLLRGMLCCWCGELMYGGATGAGRRSYRCQLGREKGRHGYFSVSADGVESEVWLRVSGAYNDPVALKTKFREAYDNREGKSIKDEIDGIEAKEGNLAKQKERALDRYVRATEEEDSVAAQFLEQSLERIRRQEKDLSDRKETLLDGLDEDLPAWEEVEGLLDLLAAHIQAQSDPMTVTMVLGWQFVLEAAVTGEIHELSHPSEWRRKLLQPLAIKAVLERDRTTSITSGIGLLSRDYESSSSKWASPSSPV